MILRVMHTRAPKSLCGSSTGIARAFQSLTIQQRKGDVHAAPRVQTQTRSLLTEWTCSLAAAVPAHHSNPSPPSLDTPCGDVTNEDSRRAARLEHPWSLYMVRPQRLLLYMRPGDRGHWHGGAAGGFALAGQAEGGCSHAALQRLHPHHQLPADELPVALQGSLGAILVLRRRVTQVALSPGVHCCRHAALAPTRDAPRTVCAPS